MPALKATLDGYNTLLAAALDGSKKVLTQRNHQGGSSSTISITLRCWNARHAVSPATTTRLKMSSRQHRGTSSGAELQAAKSGSHTVHRPGRFHNIYFRLACAKMLVPAYDKGAFA